MKSDPYALTEEITGTVIPHGDGHLRAEAHITLGPSGVTATTDSGQTFVIPWKGIRLGRSGELVTVQAANRSATISSDHPDFLHALETAGGNDIADALARISGESVSSPWRHRIGCIAALIAIPLLLLGVWRMFQGAVDATVDALPFSVDEAIGEAVWGEMDLGGPRVDDPVLNAAVQEILDRLEPYSAMPGVEFTFAVIQNDVSNAFALPGGYMVVFTGLLAQAESPEQVAGVIGHEMAHVTLRHGLRRIAHSVGLWAGISLVFGNVDALTGLALKLFQLSTVNSYSQDQEAAADLEGARMLIAAQIDPRGLADFFIKMKKEYGDVPELLAWTSTHPRHEQRSAAIQEYAREHGEGVTYQPLEIDWSAVRAAAGASPEGDPADPPGDEEELTAPSSATGG